MELNKELRCQIRAIAKEGYEKNGFFNAICFEQDFNVFFMTKKMISRFLKKGALNEKLMINNIVISLNAFGTRRTNIIFRLVSNDVQFSVIKAILLFLKSYDLGTSDDVYPNRIIQDVLKDVQSRYCLDHL